MKLFIGGYAQNKYEYVKRTYPGAVIWNEFHRFVQEQLKAGTAPDDIRQQVADRIASQPDLIIISDELGCGIVPMEKEDRLWRETTGRLLCFAAEQADEVYRMVCGIPQRLK